MAKEKVFTPTQVAVGKIVMLILQTGTANPQLTILQNTIRTSGPIVASRTAQGVYAITLNNPILDATKTRITVEHKSVNRILIATIVTPQGIQLDSYDNGGSHQDNLGPQTNICIEIYDQINMNM